MHFLFNWLAFKDTKSIGSFHSPNGGHKVNVPDIRYFCLSLLVFLGHTLELCFSENLAHNIHIHCLPVITDFLFQIWNSQVLLSVDRRWNQIKNTWPNELRHSESISSSHYLESKRLAHVSLGMGYVGNWEIFKVFEQHPNPGRVKFQDTCNLMVIRIIEKFSL